MAPMGLDRLADVPVRMLSTGQRKRATLARVIASGAPVWLLDEPANGLDADGQERLAAAMATHRAQGGAVLAATHQPIGLTTGRNWCSAAHDSLILRELRLAATGGNAVLPIIFFLLVATLFPFAVGPDAPLLARPAGERCGWQPCSPRCCPSIAWSSRTGRAACSISSPFAAPARRASRSPSSPVTG
jgi:hypothetical protein